jgi:outer membrane murein-binding lipoprotein Lpp
MDSGDLESRVTALEHQMRDLTGRVRASEQDAAAARILAGAADRDVGEFRNELRDFRQATVAGFNALREDFVDLRSDFGALRSDVGDFRSNVGALQSNVGELESNVGELQSNVGALRSGFGELRSGFGTLQQDVGQGFTEMRGKFDAVAAGQQQIADLLLTIITDQGHNRPIE